MKVRLRILLCALALVAAWCFWPRPGLVAPRAEKPAAPAAAKIVSAPALAATNAPVPAAAGKLSAAATNRLAFRLTNTPKSLKELMSDPHAILLENALIDTSAKLDLKIPAHLKASAEPGAYIVQARGLIDPAFRAALGAAGATFVSYIPENAELVQVSAAGAAVLAENPRVQAVLPYEPYYKVQSSLLGLAVAQQPLPAGTFLTLGIFAGAADSTEAQLQKLGAQILSRDRTPFGSLVRVAPPADWIALANLAGVQLLEPVYLKKAANDLTRVAVGVSTNTTDGATNNYLGLTGKNILVEVNDSGIDTNHPDFSVTGSAASPGSVPPSRITADTGASLIDTLGHGTHVAGIIAGNGSKSYLVASTPRGSVTNADFRGKAPAAKLFSVGFLGVNDSNSPALSIGDSYLQEAPALTNALISNNSWQNDGDNEYDLSAASYDAAVRDALPDLTGPQPVLFVFAAGNDGGGNTSGSGGSADTITSPGTAKDVITVGALEELRNITNVVTALDGSSNAIWAAETDTGFQVADYSSRGNVGVETEGTYGRFKPDVVAPGTFTVSTRATTWDQEAYYNVTNFHDNVESDYAESNAPAYGFMTIPQNAVGVIIQVQANDQSPANFPTNFPIYASASGVPDPNDPTTYDIFEDNGLVSIPPESGGLIGSISDLQNGGLIYAVGVPTNYASGISFDVLEEIITTNDLGNQTEVMSNLNSTIGPWYRYESGTSMATPAVSGVLALMQDFFVNQRNSSFPTNPSPALLKAMVINGARPTGSYQYGVNSGINYEGWGQVSLPNSLPAQLTNSTPNATNGVPMFFIDQSPTNTVATGDRRSYNVTVTSALAQAQPLRVTLAWTDPPGNPAAAIKLVNDLELVVSNTASGQVYYPNNFSASGTPPFSVPTAGTNAPVWDGINNVQNIFLSPTLGTNYVVTVYGRAVNVNAVTLEQTNIVQDFALVIACGDNSSAGITVTAATPALGVSAPDVSYLAATNGIYFNETAGANAPWLSTNDLVIGGDTNYGFYTNSVFHVGQTNQWHFFVVTNTTTFTNAAFITFLANTLAIPREGVFAGSDANSTTPSANLQMLVASAPDALASQITNLNFVVISNCLAGANGDAAAVGRGGTQFVAYTNSSANQAYYIGVQCDDQTAGQFGLIPVFSQSPFSTQDTNGNVYVTGLNVPVAIPDGNNAHPGVGYVFGLCLQQITVNRVIVTNTFQHQNFGDLIGAVSHGGVADILNNHDGLGAVSTNRLFIYDDSGRNDVPGSITSDGPGSLKNFTGKQAVGPWLLTEEDDIYTQTGAVTSFQMKIEPHHDYKQPSVVTVTVPPNGWFYDYIDVPVGYTNLTVFGTNISQVVAPLPVELFVNEGSQPTLSQTNYMAQLTNCVTGTFPTGTLPNNFVSLGPPLTPDRYYFGLFNPNTVSQTINISALLQFDQSAIKTVDYNSTGLVPLNDDAVTYDDIFVTNTDLIQDFSIGLRIDHPRISDLAITLISPDGSRYLLMENRGGQSTNGCGLTVITTNQVNVNANGNGQANTNSINVGTTHGTFPITYNFYTAPDEMTVYYGTNISPAYLLYDTGITNNPPLSGGPGPTGENTAPATFYVSFPPPGISAASTYLTIVMNQYTSSNRADAWTYTAGGTLTNFVYLAFTEDTNFTTTPIQFAPPPFVPVTAGVTNDPNDTPPTNIVETVTNLYYQPEQDISGINGTSGYGEWQLEILDNRAGATNNANLLSWQMQFTCANTNITVLPVLRGITNQTVIETTLMTVTNTASYAVSNATLAYSLAVSVVTNAAGVTVVTNASIDANGVITWIPTEADGPGLFQFVTTVTDAANPLATAQNFFLVSVLESNLPPAITFPTNNAVFSNLETTPFTITATATDPDLPTNTLTFGLAGLQNVNGPGISTNDFSISTNGLIFWLPAETNGPSTNIVFITCTDTNPWAAGVNQTSFTVTNQFTIVVLESNLPPVLNANLPNQTINELTTLIVTNPATDSDWPSNSLTYQVFISVNTALTLANGWPLTYLTTVPPPVITNGIIAWTPGEAQGPGVYTITTIVTDYNPWAVNNQHLTATNSFNVTVEEVNQLPVVFGVQNVTNYELTTITIPVQATNYDLPPDTLTYSLSILVDTNATTNLFGTNSLAYATTNPPPVINPTNGVINWTPTEAQGPAVYDVTVFVTDTNLYALTNQSYTVSTNFTITVLETNSAPFWTNGYPNVVIGAGLTNYVYGSATDTDLPPQTLTYSLANSPAWATIDTNFGTITLAPTANDAPTNVLITAVVTDNGNPPLSATNSFLVTVLTGLVNGQPATNIIAPGGINWFLINVPTNALAATNTLLFASTNVNLWFSTNVPPSITNAAAGDFELLTNQIAGLAVIYTNGNPALVPGGYYFLGVQNPNPVPATNAVEVTFEFSSALTPGQPATNIVAPGGLNWFQVNVPTNALAATNALIFATSPVNFWFSTNAPPSITNLAGGDFEFTNNAYGSTNVITPSTVPVLVPGGVYYLGVQNPGVTAVTNAIEVTFALAPDLTNGVPTTNTVGANSIFWHRVRVPANALAATNALLFASPDVNLWFSTNVPPTITNAAAGDFELQTNSLGGTNVIAPGTVPALVPGGVYYLGVQNTNAVPATYALQVTFEFPVTNVSIFSIVPTNSAGTNGFILTWFAPTNYQFHLQWTPSLLPVTWKEMKGVISFDSYLSATNSHFSFFDYGDTNRNSAPFGPARFYRLHLLDSPTNTPPEFLSAPLSFNAAVNQPFAYTAAARDWDIPAQLLNYFITNSLADTNVVINLSNGAITWTPNNTQAGQTNHLTVWVKDNGAPVKGATNAFAVVVYPQPAFGGISVASNGVQMTWSGSTNEQFQINWTTNLVSPIVWTPFPPPPITSTNGVFSFLDTNAPFTMKFYELILLP